MVQYPQINEQSGTNGTREDINSKVYYLDWDKILKYHSALGYTRHRNHDEYAAVYPRILGTPQKFYGISKRNMGSKKVTGNLSDRH